MGTKSSIGEYVLQTIHGMHLRKLDFKVGDVPGCREPWQFIELSYCSIKKGATWVRWENPGDQCRQPCRPSSQRRGLLPENSYGILGLVRWFYWWEENEGVLTWYHSVRRPWIILLLECPHRWQQAAKVWETLEKAPLWRSSASCVKLNPPIFL